MHDCVTIIILCRCTVQLQLPCSGPYQLQEISPLFNIVLRIILCKANSISTFQMVGKQSASRCLVPLMGYINEVIFSFTEGEQESSDAFCILLSVLLQSGQINHSVDILGKSVYSSRKVFSSLDYHIWAKTDVTFFTAVEALPP